MSGNPKKSYSFAIKTSLYLSLCLTSFTGIFLYFTSSVSIVFIFGYSFICFVLAFCIIQYRINQFIYKKIQKIYKNFNLLESSALPPENISTDMVTLSEGIEKFVKLKKLEIENLKLRDNFRKEFLGNVSHELKTPLFTVQAYIHTLLDGAMKDKTVRKKYLKRAGKGVDRLINIVKDLDLISKLETDELHLEYENFDIVAVIQDLFDLLEMKAAKKNIDFSFNKEYPSIFVYADADQIERVLLNLLNNTIKYGKNDGNTELSIEDLDSEKVIIRITDTGEGIEKANIPRLFERFFRVDKSGSRKEGGSGLGLAIVKHILEAHHQKIYVESAFGVGSEFSFTLEKAKTVPEIGSSIKS